MKNNIKPVNPYDSAMGKLYFVNLLSKDRKKYTTFNEAIYEEPHLCALADRLKPHEIQMLVGRIENIL